MILRGVISLIDDRARSGIFDEQKAQVVVRLALSAKFKLGLLFTIERVKESGDHNNILLHNRANRCVGFSGFRVILREAQRSVPSFF